MKELPILTDTLTPPPALGSPSFGKVCEVPRVHGGFMQLDFQLPSGLSEYTLSFFIRSQHVPPITGMKTYLQTFYTWDSCRGTLVGKQIVEPDILPLDSTGAWVSGPILTIPPVFEEGDDTGYETTRFGKLGLWAVHLQSSAPVVLTLAGGTYEFPAGGTKITLEGKAEVPYISVQSNPDAHVKLAVWVAKPNRYYGRLDANLAMAGMLADSRAEVTNIFKHFSARVKLIPSEKKHLYTSTFDNVDLTESLPRRVDEFEYPPRNDMTIGNQTLFRIMTFLDGLSETKNPFEIFDFRFFPNWQPDWAVESLRRGGFRSLVSRNIPLEWTP